ncbi:PHP domain-containing protein [Marispirochaeta sp.]|uniref:PHP domain-containing protein n=1 Tax=Marispirochaeta sp. TaxID=2038653 RepID=UPI0029C754F0|nr:PHP domain-containing protein [Marispirochaeta sp.]
MITADLHIHSCLSPCGSLEMSPRAIIDGAAEKGLSLIALSDHNATANCAPLVRLGSDMGIAVIPGIEVTTVEEAHVLIFFAGLGVAEDFAAFIYAHLPDIYNTPSKMGDQVAVDEYGTIVGEIEKYLGTATDLSVDRLFEEAVSRGALVVPSHIDRPYAGLIAQLGFIPDIPFHGVEVAFERNLNLAGDFAVLASSDAHIPELIGSKQSHLTCNEAPGFAALKAALENRQVVTVYGET